MRIDSISYYHMIKVINLSNFISICNDTTIPLLLHPGILSPCPQREELSELVSQ